MDRRDFLKASTLAGAGLLIDWEHAFARGTADHAVGKPWAGWKKGQFQVHFIYTGVGESMFFIFPDGTTMLLDCGDHNAIGRGKLAVPVLPDATRHAGEWIARYVRRVNPHGNKVDYMMLSHYHCDHGGSEVFYADKVIRDGKEYMLSGFSQAAEFLDFGKAIDRCWPTYDDPILLLDDASLQKTHMQKFYDYMQRERGMEMEKFRLGATDQIVPLRGAVSGFSVRNISANGRIAYPDGRIVDLYAERKKNLPKKFTENGMSLGVVFSYGPFRFYTAGDFSDKWKREDGSTFMIEDAMAEVCGEADVAKINHHGHNSMTAKLVGALRSRVWVSCVWDQLHNLPHVMALLADRSIYPDQRIICPGVFPVERRTEDAGSPWLSDINKSSFDAGHMVLCVEKGGKKYSMTYLGASDEDMIVRSVMHFKTKKR